MLHDLFFGFFLKCELKIVNNVYKTLELSIESVISH